MLHIVNVKETILRRPITIVSHVKLRNKASVAILDLLEDVTLMYDPTAPRILASLALSQHPFLHERLLISLISLTAGGVLVHELPTSTRVNVPILHLCKVQLTEPSHCQWLWPQQGHAFDLNAVHYEIVIVLILEAWHNWHFEFGLDLLHF